MIVASAVVLALSFILAWIVACALSPLLVAVHEAGHAALALLLVPGRIVVEVGRGDRAWYAKMGRLYMAYNLRPRRSGFRWRWLVRERLRLRPAGRIRMVRTSAPRHMILVALGGPAASLGLAALCAAPTVALWHIVVGLLEAYRASHDAVWALRYFTLLPWLAVCGVATVVSALLGLINLWPFRLSPADARRYGVPGTDGWMALHYGREARRRATRPMRFDHFTPRMRRVFTYAQQEALARKHSAITPLHLLLSVLREPDATAVRVLQALCVDAAPMRAHAGEALEEVATTASPASPPSLAPETKAVIERMVEEARRHGDNSIGTEHALLALLAEGESDAAHILTRHGVILDAARAAVAARRAGAPARDSA